MRDIVELLRPHVRRIFEEGRRKGLAEAVGHDPLPAVAHLAPFDPDPDAELQEESDRVNHARVSPHLHHVLGAMLDHAIEAAEGGRWMGAGLDALCGLLDDPDGLESVAKGGYVPRYTKAELAGFEKGWMADVGGTGSGHVMSPVRKRQVGEKWESQNHPGMWFTVAQINGKLRTVRTKKPGDGDEGVDRAKRADAAHAELSQQRIDALAAVKAIRQKAAAGGITAEDLRALAGHMEHLSVPELYRTRELVGIQHRDAAGAFKGSRQGDAMRAAFAAYARDKATGLDTPEDTRTDAERIEQDLDPAAREGLRPDRNPVPGSPPRGQGDDPEREQSLEEAATGSDVRFGSGRRAQHRDPFSPARDDLGEPDTSRPGWNAPATRPAAGGTRVVGEDGRPLTVYHGSPNTPFGAFDDSRRGQTTKHPTSQWGHFFTPEKGEAERYATFGLPRGETGHVVAAELDLKNPYPMSGREFARYSATGMEREAAEFKKRLVEQGYDGIHIQRGTSTDYHGRPLNMDEYVAFHPGQIRSRSAPDPKPAKLPVGSASGESGVTYGDEEDTNEPGGWSPEAHLKLAADTPKRLRKQDVGRLFDQAPEGKASELADYLVRVRPDLSAAVADALAGDDVPVPGPKPKKGKVVPVPEAEETPAAGVPSPSDWQEDLPPPQAAPGKRVDPNRGWTPSDERALEAARAADRERSKTFGSRAAGVAPVPVDDETLAVREKIRRRMERLSAPVAELAAGAGIDPARVPADMAAALDADPEFRESVAAAVAPEEPKETGRSGGTGKRPHEMTRAEHAAWTESLTAGVEPEAEINAHEITPVNDTTYRKVQSIAAAMEANGWVGPPLLVVPNDADGYDALTGSHRQAAANKVGIRVPAVVLDRGRYEAAAAAAGVSADPRESNNEEKMALLEVYGDESAERVMRREFESTPAAHEAAVRAALASGKTVPPEVLEDYPDIAEEMAAKSAVDPDASKATGDLPEPPVGVNKPAPDAAIGRSWQSGDGERQIIGVHSSGRYLVSRPGLKHPELIAPSDLEREIALDQSRKREAEKNAGNSQDFVRRWQAGQTMDGGAIARFLREHGQALSNERMWQTLQHDTTNLSTTSAESRGLSRAEAKQLHRAVSEAMSKVGAKLSHPTPDTALGGANEQLAKLGLVPAGGSATSPAMAPSAVAGRGAAWMPGATAGRRVAAPSDSLADRVAGEVARLDAGQVRSLHASRRQTADAMNQGIEGAQKALADAKDRLRTVGSKQPEKRKLQKEIKELETLVEQRRNELYRHNQDDTHRTNVLEHATLDESLPGFVRYAAARKARGADPDETYEHIKDAVRAHAAASGHGPDVGDAVAAEVAHKPTRAVAGRGLHEIVGEEATRHQMKGERAEAKAFVGTLGLPPDLRARAEQEAGGLYAGSLTGFKDLWQGRAATHHAETARKAETERIAAERAERELEGRRKADEFLKAARDVHGLPDADAETMREVVRHAHAAPTKWHAGYELPKVGSAKQVVATMAGDDPGGRFALPKTITDQGFVTDTKYLMKATPEMIAAAKEKGYDQREGKTPPVKDIIGSSVKKGLVPAKLVGGKHPGDAGESPQVLFEDETGRQAAFDARYVAAIRKFYPKAEPHLVEGATPMGIWKQDGEVVGLVMPLTSGGKEERRETVAADPPVALADLAEPGGYGPDDIEEVGNTLVAGKGDGAMSLKILGGKTGYTIDGFEGRTYPTWAKAAAAGREILSHAHGADENGELVFRPKGSAGATLPPAERDRLAYYADLRARAKAVRGAKPVPMQFGTAEKPVARDVVPVSDHFGVMKELPDHKGKDGDGYQVVHLPTGMAVPGPTWTSRDLAVQHALALQGIPGANWGTFTATTKETDPNRTKEIARRVSGVTEAFEKNELHEDMRPPESPAPKPEARPATDAEPGEPEPVVGPTTKVGTRVDTATKVGDTAPVAQPPAPGGGGGGGRTMKSSVEAGGKKVEYEHPEPLTNAAGAVTHADGMTRVTPAIGDKLKVAGVTRVSPIAGGTKPQNHPKTGQEGVFADTNKGRAFLTFENNPGLRELVANANEIDGAVSRVYQDAHAAERKKDDALRAEMKAKESELAKKIPADHARVHFIKTGDADGDPIGRHETEDGVEIPWNHPDLVRHGYASAIRPGALGAFDSVQVNSIPRAAVEKIKAEKAAKEQAKADKKAAEDRRAADAAAKARETGKPQLLRSWTEAVDEADNSLNIVEQYVHPDGSLKTRRTPTH